MSIDDTKIGPRGMRGPKGDRGAIGLEGPEGPMGLDGPAGQRGAMGLEGLPGKNGKDGKDGRDGKDGAKGKDGKDSDLSQILATSKSVLKEHEKKFDHALIDPFLIGSNKLNESGMEKGMYLQFDGTELVYSNIKQVAGQVANQLLPYWAHGYALPSQTGNSGKYLTTDGTSESWATVSGSGSVATDTIFDAKGDLAVGTGADTASRLAVGTNGQVLTADSAEATGIKWATVAGTGDVVGPASATDNAIARFDTTTGKLLQDSVVTIADITGNIAGPQEYKLRGTTSGTTAIVATAIAGTTTVTLPAATDTLVGKATTDTFTNKTFDADGTGNSITNIENADIKAGAAIAVNKLAALAVSEVVVTDASGFLTNVTGVSSTEVGYLNGVTSALQTQIDAKGVGTWTDSSVSTGSNKTFVAPVLGAATGTSLQLSGLTASEIVITDGSKNLSSAAVATYPSLTELTYVKGVTSAIQTQFTGKAPVNSKVRTIGFSATGTPTTGQKGSFVVFPVAGTITGYKIVANAGTCTIKTWKIASGTAAPTIANVISTSGVALSSGTAIISSTTSDFTSTAVSANDIFAFDLTAVSGVTLLLFELEITIT